MSVNKSPGNFPFLFGAAVYCFHGFWSLSRKAGEAVKEKSRTSCDPVKVFVLNFLSRMPSYEEKPPIKLRKNT